MERAVVVGSDVDLAAARELALKLNEGVWLSSVAHELEDVVHGHLVSHDDKSALIALAARRDRQPAILRLQAVLRVARRIGMATALIASEEVEVDPDLVSAGRIGLVDEPQLPASFAALAASAIGLQRLTLALAHTRGRNPDHLRRDVPAYREARRLAEAKFFREQA